MHVEQRPSVSVVIPTWRRARMLMQCLSALLDQTLPAERYEIIVCDDDADENVHSLIDRLAAFEGSTPMLRYLPVTETQGPAGARNVGWRAARAPIVAFTDDDTLPDPMWLQRGLQAMDADVDALCGRIIMPLPEKLTDLERDASGLQDAEFVTANCFVRRKALLAVGGFDERYTQAWREDSDLHFALLKHGCHIKRTDQAVVIHPLRPAPFAAGLRMQRKAMFDALLYRKHRAHYRQYVRKPLPWLYLLITLTLLVAVISAIAGQPTLAIGASGVWLILTISLFFYRLRGTILSIRNITELLVTSALNPLLSIFWRTVGHIRFRGVSS
ncbi:MAG TPA: glycosyltransferase [Burkholderiaceae bacterium]|nr:glycosyltransferase [Burkholderiaceae bacterium]